MQVESFIGPEAPDRLDLTIDGADQATPSSWLVNDGGGAHTREKALAAAADRFIVIVSSNKLVQRLSPPLPLELLDYCSRPRWRGWDGYGCEPRRAVRTAACAPITWARSMTRATAARLSSTTGLIEHGRFAPALVSGRLVARGECVDRITTL